MPPLSGADHSQHPGGKARFPGPGCGQRGLPGAAGRGAPAPSAGVTAALPAPHRGAGTVRRPLTCASPRAAGEGAQGQAPGRNLGAGRSCGDPIFTSQTPAIPLTPPAQPLSPTSARRPASPLRTPRPRPPAARPGPARPAASGPITFPFRGLPFRNRVTRRIAPTPPGPE